MDILFVLRKLGELENQASKAYEWIASILQNDAKARGFFLKLSEVEKAHFDLVKYQERVVRKSPKDFAPVDVDITAIDRAIAMIAAFRTTTPGLRDAIRFALDLETEIAVSYAASVMEQSNKDFAQVVQGLTANASQGDHYQELIRFAAAH